MSDLDIYDPPAAAKQLSVPASKPPGVIRSKVKEYSSKIKTKITEKRDYCASVEDKVLTTVKPVTKYIPITYDTVKRVSVISLCTLSGVLQGRKCGGFRRYLYPVVGLMGGNTACYPKQTYKITSRTLNTTLPLIATAGKLTVDGGTAVVHQTIKVSSFIYEKLKEPTPVPTQSVSVDSTDLDTEIVSETVGDEVIWPSEHNVEDNLANEVSNTVPEHNSLISNAEVTAPEESSDKIISLEKIAVPVEVVPIKENLGMGDLDHSDMYSTRSRRS